MAADPCLTAAKLAGDPVDGGRSGGNAVGIPQEGQRDGKATAGLAHAELQRFDTVNRLAQLRRRQFLLLRCLIGKKADQIAILMGEMGGSYGLAAAENELCGARERESIGRQPQHGKGRNRLFQWKQDIRHRNLTR